MGKREKFKVIIVCAIFTILVHLTPTTNYSEGNTAHKPASPALPELVAEIDTDDTWYYVHIQFSYRGDLALVKYDGPGYQNDSLNYFKLWHITEKRLILEEHDVLAEFSLDGRTLAVSSENGLVHLVDAYTGIENYSLGNVYFPVSSLVFHPDGNYIAVGYANGTINLINIITEQMRTIDTGENSPINRLQFSPSGQFLVSVTTHFTPSIRLWDLESLSNSVAIIGYMMRLSELLFSPDESLLAISGTKMTGAANTGIVRLYDTKTGQQLTALGGVWGTGELPDVTPDNVFHNPHPHRYFVHDLAFIGDGTLLASASGDAVRIWDVPTAIQHKIGIEVRGTPNLDEQVYFYHPPGTGGMGDAMRHGVSNMILNPSKTILAYGDIEGKVHLLDVTSPDGIQETLLDTGQEDFVWYVAFSPDGQMLTTSAEDHFQIWDMVTFSPLDDYSSPLFEAGRCHRATFSPDGKFIGLRLCGGAVQIWKLKY